VVALVTLLTTMMMFCCVVAGGELVVPEDVDLPTGSAELSVSWMALGWRSAVAFVILSLGRRRFYPFVFGDLRRRRSCHFPATVNLVQHRWALCCYCKYGRRMVLACVEALTTMTDIVGGFCGRR